MCLALLDHRACLVELGQYRDQGGCFLSEGSVLLLTPCATRRQLRIWSVGPAILTSCWPVIASRGCDSCCLTCVTVGPVGTL